jgi:hypothetical protein
MKRLVSISAACLAASLLAACGAASAVPQQSPGQSALSRSLPIPAQHKRQRPTGRKDIFLFNQALYLCCQRPSRP